MSLHLHWAHTCLMFFCDEMCDVFLTLQKWQMRRGPCTVEVWTEPATFFNRHHFCFKEWLTEKILVIETCVFVRHFLKNEWNVMLNIMLNNLMLNVKTTDICFQQPSRDYKQQIRVWKFIFATISLTVSQYFQFYEMSLAAIFINSTFSYWVVHCVQI